LPRPHSNVAGESPVPFLSEIEDVRRELDAAREWRNKHLGVWSDLIAEVTGSSYREVQEGVEEGENFALAYVSLVLPRVAFDVPKVVARSDDPEGSILAEELELALNTWAPRANLRNEAQRVAMDFLLSWGVTLTVNEKRSARRTDLGGAGYSPRVYRISPDRFFLDPAAEDQTEARYMGHSFVRSREAMIDHALANPGEGWIVEAIESLAASEDVHETGEIGAQMPNGIHGNVKRDVPFRDEIEITEIWVPELDHPDSKAGQHHGTIITVGESASGVAEFVREPRPYYGPPSGPYDVAGAYIVPGDCWPLGPLTAAYGMVRELNSHMEYVSESVKHYRRVIFVDKRKTKLAQNIASTPDLFVVPVDDLDPDSFFVAEFGGITQQQMQWAQMSRERLERLTGINEVIRGNVTGQATATEVQTASASSGLRIEFIKRQFIESMNRVMRKVAWYMCVDKQVRVPLGSVGQRLTRPASMFLGGRIDPGDVDLDIDAFSVERTDDALLQRRAVEMLQMTLQLAQAKLALPGGANYDDLADRIGQMLNMPEFGDVLRVQQPMQLGMGGMGGMPGIGTAPQAGPATLGGLNGSAAAGIGRRS
jgi:hypothetical protein